MKQVGNYYKNHFFFQILSSGLHHCIGLITLIPKITIILCANEIWST